MTSRVSDQTRRIGLSAAFEGLRYGLQIALLGGVIAGGFVPSAQAQTEAESAVGGTLRNEIERSLTTPILPKIEPKSGSDRPAEKKTKG